MKKTWSTNIDEISKEIDLLIAEKARLTCLREKKRTTALYVKGKTQLDNSNLLMLSTPRKEICPKKRCLFYYHREGCPIRGFHCTPEMLLDGLLGVHYPTEIFEIQRRKFPRIQVPPDSRANFALLNRQGLHVGRIEDISLEGARISGDFPIILEKGSIITPITLTLMPRSYRRHGDETIIHIPEATVMWSKSDEDVTREFAVHFILQELQLQALGHYILCMVMKEED
jgi:hypothetical protein